VLLVAGRFQHGKGIHCAVKIMPGLLKKFPDLRLLILGEADLANQAMHWNLKSSASTWDRVIMPGWTTDIFNYLRASDIVLSPSLVTELRAHAVEAMAVERPVIAPKAGGFLETVRHGETVFSTAG